MIHHRFITQPESASEYRSMLVDALHSYQFDRIDCALAYVTDSGVDALLECVGGATSKKWNSLTKRWLVGIDWCRSQPTAIDALVDFTHATVRVHDGKAVVRRQACTPRVPYHPKAWILSGPGTIGVVSGSGNLSRNGMTFGHEVGSLMIVSRPTTAEKSAHAELRKVEAWFNALWKQAVGFQSIRAGYIAQYESSERLKFPVPTDDDASSAGQLVRGTSGSGAQLTAVQLRQLRSARFFWIEAGRLSENLGKGHPGNQLMMKRMTRVYFGRPASDVPENTHFGTVRLRFQGGAVDDYSLRFSDNSMDVMSLPAPGYGGPLSYDNETLLFERRADGTFNLSVLSPAERKAARLKSNAAGALFTMKGSGRQFGVY